MPLFKTKTSQNVLAKEGYKQVVKLILAAYLWGNEQAKDDDAPKEIKKNKKGMRQCCENWWWASLVVPSVFSPDSMNKQI